MSLGRWGWRVRLSLPPQESPAPARAAGPEPAPPAPTPTGRHFQELPGGSRQDPSPPLSRAAAAPLHSRVSLAPAGVPRCGDIHRCRDPGVIGLLIPVFHEEGTGPLGEVTRLKTRRSAPPAGASSCPGGNAPPAGNGVARRRGAQQLGAGGHRCPPSGPRGHAAGGQASPVMFLDPSAPFPSKSALVCL